VPHYLSESDVVKLLTSVRTSSARRFEPVSTGRWCSSSTAPASTSGKRYASACGMWIHAPTFFLPRHSRGEPDGFHSIVRISLNFWGVKTAMSSLVRSGTCFRAGRGLCCVGLRKAVMADPTNTRNTSTNNRGLGSALLQRISRDPETCRAASGVDDLITVVTARKRSNSRSHAMRKSQHWQGH
jgi:hypothetical protein